MMFMIIQANMLQSVGCEVATMMFVDGQVITVGTPKGKNFLQNPCIQLLCRHLILIFYMVSSYISALFKKNFFRT